MSLSADTHCRRVRHIPLAPGRNSIVMFGHVAAATVKIENPELAYPSLLHYYDLEDSKTCSSRGS
jgi:hypothetical protein